MKTRKVRCLLQVTNHEGNLGFYFVDVYCNKSQIEDKSFIKAAKQKALLEDLTNPEFVIDDNDDNGKTLIRYFLIAGESPAVVDIAGVAK